MVFRANMVHMADGGGGSVNNTNSSAAPASPREDNRELKTIFEDLLKENDANQNGILEKDELSGIEDEYLQLLEHLGGLDGDDSSYTYEDVETAEGANWGFSQDTRLSMDENQQWTVTVEEWDENGSTNASLDRIVSNSFNIPYIAQLSGMSEAEVRDVIYDKLVEMNGLEDPTQLQVGQQIKLDGAYGWFGIDNAQQKYGMGASVDWAAIDAAPEETTTPPIEESTTPPVEEPTTPPAEVDYTQVENLEGLLETLPEGSEAYNQVNAIISAYDSIEFAEANGLSIDTYSNPQYNVSGLLSDALSDDVLSVDQKIALVSVMSDKDNDAVINALPALASSSYGLNGVQWFNEMLQSCETPEQAIFLAETCDKVYDDGVREGEFGYFANFFSGNNKNDEDAVAFIDKLIDLYQGATPEEIEQLNRLYDTPSLIQTYLKKDVETQRIKDLITNMGGLPTDDEIMANIDAEDKKHLDLYEDNYSTVKSILKGVDEGKLEPEIALYLLSQHGDLDKILEEFRDMKDKDEESYLSTLLGLF